MNDKAGHGRKTSFVSAYYSITVGIFADFFSFADGLHRPMFPALAMELLGKLMGPFRILT